MTSRERVLAALRLEQPDRVPFLEAAVDRGLAQKLMNWPHETDVGASSRSENPYNLEEAKALCGHLGLDGLSYILRAPAFARSHVGKDGRAFVGEGMIKNRADFEGITLPDPAADELYEEAAAFADNKGDLAACLVTRIGLLQVMLGLGIQNFSLALYDDPALVEDMLDMYFDWTAVMAQKVSQLGFDLFWTTDDFAHKTGLMFSPRVFEEMLAPRYKRVLERLSIPWVLHSDGNISEVLDLLIDWGVAGIHPLEKGAMDLAVMKRDYGGKVCLLGNLDLNILAAGTPQQTVDEVKDIIKTAGPGGGYILTSGNSLASYLEPDNVEAMARAVKDYGQYPLAVV